MTQKTKIKGIYPICALQLMGMIGFSMIFSLIVLYCTNKLGMSNNSAYAISAAFNGLAFATSVPGGYLAEKLLGFRFATSISIVLCAIGLFVLALPMTVAIYVGLGIFIFGTGMFIPCIFVLLGRLFDDKANKNVRENAFVLAYVGMNAGAFLASAVSGSLANFTGYSSAFLVGGIFALLMLPLFLHYQKDYQLKSTEGLIKIINKQTKQKGLLYTALLTAGTCVLVCYADFCDSLLLILGAACLVLILKMASKESQLVKKKLFAFAILTTISVIFWTLYSLAPSVLTIFIEKNVNKHVFGLAIPTADISCLNPFFIVAIGPLMFYFWSFLKKFNINISTAAKFGIGVILMGVGYLVLIPAIGSHNSAGFVGLNWIVISYFLQTVGELLVGPIGYAMVGELVPKAKEGFMMGIWQLGCGVGAALSDFFAKFSHTNNVGNNPLHSNAIFSSAFSHFAWITIVVGVFALLIAPKLAQIAKAKTKAASSLLSEDVALSS